MLYGKNLNTLDKIALKIKDLNELKQTKQGRSKTELINQLMQQLKIINSQFDDKKAKYIIIMKRNFDKNKTQIVSDKFAVGDNVAYYVGDRANTTRKLRQRFTGPWTITEKINENTYKIMNKDLKETMCCHVQMLKKYHKQNFTPLIQYERSEKEKNKIQNRMKQNKRQNEKSGDKKNYKNNNLQTKTYCKKRNEKRKPNTAKTDYTQYTRYEQIK